MQVYWCCKFAYLANVRICKDSGTEELAEARGEHAGVRVVSLSLEHVELSATSAVRDLASAVLHHVRPGVAGQREHRH